MARAALAGGATWLAVALVEEGALLRDAGIDAPILVLSEQHESSVAELVQHGLVASVYTEAGIDALGSAVDGTAVDGTAVDGTVLEVHLTLDTGMRRVGAEPGDVAERVAQIAAYPSLRLGAIWTHCPVADEPDNPFTADQLERFDSAVTEQGIATHVGNSAVAIEHPDRPASMVRCGISIYGIDPDDALAGRLPLQPAMTLRSEVTFMKTISAGESVGYGHRWTAPTSTTIATVPIGYADGVRRDLGLRGGEVLIGGQRFPIVGVVTMDQLMVDLGESTCAVGDEVVLIGEQGDEQILAADVAQILDTIPYEVVCSVSERVPRAYVNR